MAKSKTPIGLSPDFDIKVSAEDLIGKPAQIADYLDDDSERDLIAVLRRRQEDRRASLMKQAGEESATPPPGGGLGAEAFRAVVPAPQPQAVAAPVEPPVTVMPPSVQPPVVALPPPTSPERGAVPTQPRRRVQINLAPDTERQIDELLEILRAQGAEKHVRFNDIIQGLVHALYEARMDLNLSHVPARGRWGRTMAKSFPVALSQAFRDAVVRFADRNRGATLRNAIGS